MPMPCDTSSKSLPRALEFNVDTRIRVSACVDLHRRRTGDQVFRSSRQDIPRHEPCVAKLELQKSRQIVFLSNMNDVPRQSDSTVKFADMAQLLTRRRYSSLSPRNAVAVT
jgi:hypothetical protein